MERGHSARRFDRSSGAILPQGGDGFSGFFEQEVPFVGGSEEAEAAVAAEFAERHAAALDAGDDALRDAGVANLVDGFDELGVKHAVRPKTQ